MAQSGAEGTEPETVPGPFERIFFAVVGTILLASIIGSWLSGRKAKEKKPGDDHPSTVFALAGFVFVVSILLAVFTKNGVWILLALPAWLVGFISQERGERRRRREIQALRAQNAKDYPGVFDRDPPQDLDAAPGDLVDVYDACSCTYIGRFPKSDIRNILDRVPNVQSAPSNDIFFLLECLDDPALSSADISQPFRDALNAAFEEHGDPTLRWMPVRKEGEAGETEELL